MAALEKFAGANELFRVRMGMVRSWIVTAACNKQWSLTHLLQSIISLHCLKSDLLFTNQISDNVNLLNLIRIFYLIFMILKNYRSYSLFCFSALFVEIGSKNLRHLKNAVSSGPFRIQPSHMEVYSVFNH